MTALSPFQLSVQPTLSLGGNISYTIQGDRVLLEIDSIANNQEPGLTSGTLAIELWALSSPYLGNEFSGYALAATTIGELNSQYFLSNCRYDLNFQTPPQGTWTLTLMLREWDGQGYVTRDYLNFALPYVRQDEAPVSKAASKVVHLAFSTDTSKAPVAQVLHSSEFQSGIDSSASKDQVKQKIKADSKNKTATKLKETKAGKEKKHSKEVKSSKKKETAKIENLSKEETAILTKLNKLKKGDFLSIKGIVPKLAEDLIAAQPYAQISDLMSVKGVGKQKFEAIQAGLLSK